MTSHAPLSGLVKVACAGLIATAAGFLLASVDPGPGPRFVKGAVNVGIFYLPPLLMGLTVLVMAGLLATGLRWMPGVAAAFAAALLVGSVTIASASVLYRLTHPEQLIGFVADTLQVGGEVVAIAAGIAAIVQLLRGRRGSARTADAVPG